MTKNVRLKFMRETMEELRSALFFPLCDSPLRMPSCVVQVITVDEVGQVWFTVPAPSQRIMTFDPVFQARLDFFRKGKDFYLKALATAFIETDPEKINCLGDLDQDIKTKVRTSELVLLRLEIIHLDYFHTPEYRKYYPALKGIRSLLHKWLTNSAQGHDPSTLENYRRTVIAAGMPY